MARIVAIILVGVIALAVLDAAPALQAASMVAQVPLAVSTFDQDADGWTTMFSDGTGNPPRPTFTPTGGNPGGYIFATDDQTGPLWFWIAPTKFVGNKSAAYGRALTFDLKQSDISAPTDLPDVVLASDTITLTYDFKYPPNSTWTGFAVNLTEHAGWIDQRTGRAPSERDFKAVLGSLATLQIRAEYNRGPDIDGIDNVRLGVAPQTRTFLPQVMR